MSEMILTIHNRHPAACGFPPAFSTDAARLYIGYFQNRHGEQSIFTFNRASGEVRLRGGDVGRASARTVPDARVDGLILAAQGVAWLQTCGNATRA